VVGILVGAGVGIGVVAYLVIPKQKTIEGCIQSSDGGLLLNDKDGHTYTLATNGFTLRPGRWVTLKGKGGRRRNVNREFEVRKMIKDERDCAAVPNS
jgi:hypothetical protein